jgi:hypothetical protein
MPHNRSRLPKPQRSRLKRNVQMENEVTDKVEKTDPKWNDCQVGAALAKIYMLLLSLQANTVKRGRWV